MRCADAPALLHRPQIVQLGSAAIQVTSFPQLPLPSCLADDLPGPNCYDLEGRSAEGAYMLDLCV